MKIPDTRGKLPVIALGIMLVALVISNVLLIRQNLQMRAALNKLHPQIENLQVGDSVPPFSALGLHDEHFEVNYTGKERKRVLLYLSPSCPYSRQQLNHWKELISKADDTRFEVLGLVGSSEDKIKVDEYIRSSSPAGSSQPLLPIAMLPEDVYRSYKLSVTPTTLVIANDGRVEQVWVGKWNHDDTARASSFFGFEFTQP
jgi:peroxiredoxin